MSKIYTDQQQNFFCAALLVWCGWNVALGTLPQIKQTANFTTTNFKCLSLNFRRYSSLRRRKGTCQPQTISSYLEHFHL